MTHEPILLTLDNMLQLFTYLILASSATALTIGSRGLLGFTPIACESGVAICGYAPSPPGQDAKGDGPGIGESPRNF